MKSFQYLTFFGVVFAIYGLINFYIIRRGLSVVPQEQKAIYLAAAIFVALAYLAGRFLERTWASPVSDLLIWVGSFWIAFMLYFFLCLIIVDLFRLVNAIIPFFPSVITNNIAHSKQFVALVVLIMAFVSVAGGFINTTMIATRKYAIGINKSAGGIKSLNIAVASDIHLGSINGPRFLSKVVDKINKLNPDIILLPGDILDENIAPLLRNGAGEELKKLKAKYGVYAVTGNHEFIGGIDQSAKFLTDHGVNLIRDSVILIENSFYLAGRDDRTISRFTLARRKELPQIIKGIDKSLPIIMMDHQPYGLNEAFENGIDLQLSGHTHNGQLWPLNYIIEKIYELAWGYKRIGNTHYYVSCGVGLWGPPIRTGSRPEVVNIKLNFIGK